MTTHDLLTFLLNALWQIPVILLVAILGERIMRSGPASHRHVLWVTALVAALALPVISIRPHTQSLPLSINVRQPTILPGIAAPAASPAALPAAEPERRTIPFSKTASTFLLIAYAIFVLARLASIARAWLRTVHVKRDSTTPSMPSALDKVWSNCLRAFKLHGVELLSSTRIPSPITTGAISRAIILPQSLLGEASENILTTVIGHEMAHIARGDFALSLVYEALYAPIAFHPAAWLIARGIERTREMACDELVTEKLLDPGVYAESILSIAASMTGLPQPGYTLGVFDGDILEERIRRLVARPAANFKRARLLFATGLSVLAICAVTAYTLSLTARAQSGAETEITLGVDAYNRGDFQAAVSHFENATRQAPTATKPKLLLANALMRQFYAESGKPDSLLLAAASHQYQDVLAYESTNRQAMQGMVAICMEIKQLTDARAYALKLIASDPSDRSAYYTAGVVDWAIVFPEFQKAKLAAGGNVQDYAIPDPGVRKRLRDQYLTVVEDGLHMEQAALQLDAAHSDAMAYTNLLYRLKAGLVDNPVEAASYMAQAEAWVHKALVARQQQAGNAPPLSTQLSADGPPPGPPSAIRMVKAPPPPPPPPSAGLLATEKRIAVATPPPNSGNLFPLTGQYWQVMGAGDEALAADVYRQLRARGFAAMMHDSPVDHQVRVIAGPYFDTKSLEAAKTNLQAAGFRPIRSW